LLEAYGSGYSMDNAKSQSIQPDARDRWRRFYLAVPSALHLNRLASSSLLRTVAALE
jgi:hypothetical protein